MSVGKMKSKTDYVSLTTELIKSLVELNVQYKNSHPSQLYMGRGEFPIHLKPIQMMRIIGQMIGQNY